MRPVTQSRTGEHGTCFRASLASILNLKEKQVPDFGESNEDPGIDTFLAKYGLHYQEVPIGDVAPTGYHVITGISPRGGMHAVVGLDGQIVWDPHPPELNDGQGLAKPKYYGLLLPVAKDSRAEAEALKSKHDELKNSPVRHSGGEPAYRALRQPTTELVKEAERLLAKTRTDDQPFWAAKVASAYKYLATADKNAGLHNWGQAAAYLDAALTMAHTVIDKLRHTGRAKDGFFTSRLDRYPFSELLDVVGIDVQEFLRRTVEQRERLIDTAIRELDKKTGRAKDTDPRDGVTKCQACGVGLMGDDVLERGGKVICPECADSAVRHRAKDTTPEERRAAKTPHKFEADRWKPWACKLCGKDVDALIHHGGSHLSAKPALDRSRLYCALDVVMDSAKDGFLDDPKNIPGALKNLKGHSREWGGPKPKATPHVQDYPTWAQLKKNAKVRVKATGQELKVVSTDIAWVALSDGKEYLPKQLELV